MAFVRGDRAWKIGGLTVGHLEDVKKVHDVAELMKAKRAIRFVVHNHTKNPGALALLGSLEGSG